MCTSPETHGGPADSVRLAANTAGPPCPELVGLVEHLDGGLRAEYEDDNSSLKVTNPVSGLSVNVTVANGQFHVPFDRGGEPEPLDSARLPYIAARRIERILSPVRRP